MFAASLFDLRVVIRIQHNLAPFYILWYLTLNKSTCAFASYDWMYS